MILVVRLGFLRWVGLIGTTWLVMGWDGRRDRDVPVARAWIPLGLGVISFAITLGSSKVFSSVFLYPWGARRSWLSTRG
jgi:heme A synthase